MKFSADLRNLKIISVAEGKEISTVKDIIIDPTKGTLAFFIINQPIDYLGARIIAFEDVLGLGDYALIINDSTVIQDVAHNSLAIELLQKRVKVIGSQLLTTKGTLLGQVSEFMIDEETGKITGFVLVDSENKTSQCHCDHVLTYGQEIILIEQDNQDTLASRKERKQNAAANSVRDKEYLRKKIEEFGKKDSLLKSEANNSEVIEFPQDFNVFEQRQLQFLVGKILTKDVKLETGNLLKAGEQITQESLAGIKSRQTLMQLTAHVMK